MPYQITMTTSTGNAAVRQFEVYYPPPDGSTL
jgi:hypothetical protein